MDCYLFDIEIATEYGVNEAIMISVLSSWIKKNEANERYFHDGRYWTYRSAEALTFIFPFWSAGQIRRILISLIEKGILLTGNYNQSTYDRTTWYAFSDSFISKFHNQQIHLSKTKNGFIENERPIQDNNIPPHSNNTKVLYRVPPQGGLYTETDNLFGDQGLTPSPSPSPVKKDIFYPPTVEEVERYCQDKGFFDIDAESFVAFYESKGWMIGKNKMKSWRAAITTWRKRNGNNQGNRVSAERIVAAGEALAAARRYKD